MSQLYIRREAFHQRLALLSNARWDSVSDLSVLRNPSKEGLLVFHGAITCAKRKIGTK
jgi:hypothetical protein